MTTETEEFIRALNDVATRLGVRPVTDRMVRDWVDERLIAPRRASGRGRGRHPVWRFTEEDFRWAVSILTLKARNIRRVAELRLRLWINDDTFPIEKIPQALRSEFSRFMQRARRKLRFKYDHRHQKRLTKEDEQRYSKQLPPLDDVLAASGFKIQAKPLLEMTSELLWGNDGQEKLPRHMATEAARIVGKSIEENAAQLDLSGFAGLFGAQDEIGNSGEVICG